MLRTPLNTQPTEKKFERDIETGELDIVKIFPTIQGEGPFAGLPAVFVRLAGCNLMCPKCDTDYTTDRHTMSVANIIEEINAVKEGGLVVITGGEPFRQHISPLVWELVNTRAGRHKVQIETNGTLYESEVPWLREVTVVCSPKTGEINHRLQPLIGYYKYVVKFQETDSEDGLPTKTLGNECRVAKPHPYFPRENIFIQPLDEYDGSEASALLTEMNTQHAIQICMKFGYRLSLQLHKTLGLE